MSLTSSHSPQSQSPQSQSPQSSRLIIPKDVWNMIIKSATIDKVYIVYVKSISGNFTPNEVGVYKDIDEAYKHAASILGNYCLGYASEYGNHVVFQKLLKFIYHHEVPLSNPIKLGENNIITQYPKSYIDIYNCIKALVSGNVKIMIDIVEKNVI